MVTAANKEAARDAFVAGEAALRQKDYARAAKLLKKAQQLDPLIEGSFPTFSVLLSEADSGAAANPDAGQSEARENEPNLANAEDAEAAERDSERLQAVTRVLNNAANYYNVLGVARTALDNEITKCFRKLSLLVHPDKNSHPHAVEAFKILNQASTTLLDPAERMKYDQKIGYGYGFGFYGQQQAQAQAQPTRPPPQAFPPSKPTPVILVQRTASLIRVRWSPPPENGSPITSYTLLVDEMLTYMGVAVSYEVMGLRPNTRHCFKVFATNARGNSLYSDTVWFETDIGIPGAPAPPVAVSIKKNQIKVKWGPPADDGGSPIIEFELEVNGAKHVFPPTKREHTITQLRPMTTYRVRVMAKNKACPGPFSSFAEFTTESAPPARVAEVRVLSATASELHVGWSPSTAEEAGPADGFLLFLDDREVYRGEETSFRVTGLKPATTFKLTACAFNRFGNGPKCPAVRAKTDAGVPGRPEAPRLKKATATSIEIEFAAPADTGGAPVKHFVVRRVGDEGEPSRSVLPSFTARGLRPATAYRFQVAARNDKGASEFSDEAEFCTAPGAPGPCGAPRVLACGATWVEVAWAAPEADHGSPVTSYTLAADGRGVYEGPETRFRVERLSPFAVHSFAVAARNAVGTGPGSPPATHKTLHDVPARMPPPRLVEAGSGELEVEVGYAHEPNAAQPDERACVTLFLLLLDGRPAAAAAPGLSGATSFRLPGLAPATRYSIRVAALNEAGLSRLSHDLSAITRSAPPGRVSGLRVAAAEGAGCAVLEWEPPAAGSGGYASAYEVRLVRGPAPAGATSSALWRGEEARCVLAGLKAGEEYAFAVAARNADGSGEPREPAPFTTPAAAPDAPEKPERLASTSSAVRLKWAAPAFNGGSPVTSFVLQMQGIARPWETIYMGAACEFRARDLQPVHLYKFRVAAVNGLGTGAFSAPCPVLTSAGPPGPPMGLRLAGKGEGRVSVEWGPPERDGGEPVRKYSLECRVAGRGEYVELYLGAARGYDVEGLLGGREYELRVSALNAKGAGDPCEPLRIATDAAAPEKPVAPPRAVAAGAEWIELAWEVANGRGDDNITYTVQMRVDEKTIVEAYRGPECRARVEGLAPRTEYRFRLQAANSCGNRGWTQVAVLSTGPCEQPPGLPERLRATEVTERTALIEWEAPTAAPRSVDEYIVRINGRVYYRGPDRVYEAGRLRADTEYIFSVAASNELGSSRFAPALAVRTLPAAGLSQKQFNERIAEAEAEEEQAGEDEAESEGAGEGAGEEAAGGEAGGGEAAAEAAEAAEESEEEAEEERVVRRKAAGRRRAEAEAAPARKRAKVTGEEEEEEREERTPERASQGNEDGAQPIDVDDDEEEAAAAPPRKRRAEAAAGEGEGESGGEGPKRAAPALRAPPAKKARKSAPKPRRASAGKPRPGLFGACEGDKLKQASIATFFGGRSSS